MRSKVEKAVLHAVTLPMLLSCGHMVKRSSDPSKTNQVASDCAYHGTTIAPQAITSKDSSGNTVITGYSTGVSCYSVNGLLQGIPTEQTKVPHGQNICLTERTSYLERYYYKVNQPGIAVDCWVSERNLMSVRSATQPLSQCYSYMRVVPNLNRPSVRCWTKPIDGQAQQFVSAGTRLCVQGAQFRAVQGAPFVTWTMVEIPSLGCWIRESHLQVDNE